MPTLGGMLSQRNCSEWEMESGGKLYRSLRRYGLPASQGSGGAGRYADRREVYLPSVFGVGGKVNLGGMVCRSEAEVHDTSPPGMADQREAMP